MLSPAKTAFLLALCCCWAACGVQGAVLEVTADSFAQQKSSNPMLLVEFASGPFAGGLIRQVDEVRAENGLLGVALGRCDVAENPSMITTENLHVTPIWKLYKNGVQYHAAQELDDVIRFLHSFLVDSPHIVSSQNDLDALVKVHGAVVVGFFQQNDNSKMSQIFDRLADTDRMEHTYARANFASSTYPSPSVVIFHEFGDNQVYADAVPSEGGMHKWIQMNAIAVFKSLKYTGEFYDYVSSGRSIVFLVTDASQADTQSVVNNFRSMAPELGKHARLVHVDSTLLPYEAQKLGNQARKVSTKVTDPSSPHHPHHALVVVRTAGGNVVHAERLGGDAKGVVERSVGALLM